MFGINEPVYDVVYSYRDRVVVCLETAADYVGLCSGPLVPATIHVYSESQIDDSRITTHVVQSCFDGREVVEIDGVFCTSEEQTLLDLLDNEVDVDIQLLCESLANYYFGHNESFGALESRMTASQLDVLGRWREDAVGYYMED